jgi:outer membrane protein assembly factor BamB
MATWKEKKVKGMKRKTIVLAFDLLLLFSTFAATIKEPPNIRVTSSLGINPDWWRMFRHDLRHEGNSTSEAPDNLQVLWNNKTGDFVYSSPAVYEGKVFVGSNDKNVYALDENTGSLVWNYTTGDSVSSSPAVADGKVFVGSDDGNVYALNESTGLKVWNYTTGDAVHSSPAVADGKVFVGSRDYNVYALNEGNGSFVWNYLTDRSVYSSPAVADGKVFVGSDDGYVYALDESNQGKEVWRCPTGSSVSSSPAVADGKVFVGSNDGKVYAFGKASCVLTITAATGGVTDPPNGTYYNTTGVVEPVYNTPAEGYYFDHWQLDGVLAGFDNPIIVNMTVSHELHAVFKPANPGHDVVIRKINTSKTVVGESCNLTVTVISMNIGNFTETCDVIVNAGAASIGSRTFPLRSGVTTPVTLECNTSGLAYESYTLCAHAEPVLNETNATNNDCADGLITVTIPGDVDGDFAVKLADLVFLAWAYGSKPGDTKWNPNTDIDNNGIVGLGDLVIMANHYGQTDMWPMFHHDRKHRGYSTSRAPNSNQTLWTPYRTGDMVESSPAVADGKVFVGSYDKKIYALDESKGNLWPTWTLYRTGGIVESSPAVADGMVFVGSDNGIVYALNYTGSVQWRNLTATSVVLSSPAVADGMVFVGSSGDYVYALNESTGFWVWNYKTGKSVYSSPAVADGMVFVGSNDGNVYALNESTGLKVWNYTTGASVYSSPAVADGKVFVGSEDGNVYALDEGTGSLVWSYTTGGPVYSSPAVADGMVFVGSDDGNVYAFGLAH